ncbi:MAG: hypothetical protein AB7E47_09745 [Desulfovibrionaceae bacterium]
MEHVLLKIARQLNAYDEASLMSLWDKYSETVQNFEPTKRWEEAALVFGLIQALRWKNQLFNYHWAEDARPAAGGPHLTRTAPSLEDIPDTPGAAARDGEASRAPGAPSTPVKQRAKVLRFRSREDDEPV